MPPELADRRRPQAARRPSGKEYRRYYPTGDMTAHIVSFTGVDDQGASRASNWPSEQPHRPGREPQRHQGPARPDRRRRQGACVPQDGRTSAWRWIPRSRYLAYSQLRAAVSENHAKAGGAIVIDARSGEILALVNWPTYNPNNREHLSGAQLRNRA